MTPHEKAVGAINHRLARLQANLREAKEESTQQFLLQSIIVTIGIAEALSGCFAGIGQHAQSRHAELKQANAALEAQHAELLKSGQEWLEKLKANPADRSLRQQIEQVEHAMAGIQKSLRRGASALQRELSASVAMIDPLAVTVRRFGEADGNDVLKRVVKGLIEQVRDRFGILSGETRVDAETWENTAAAEIDQAADFYDAYARAGYQVVRALEWMALTVAAEPPQSTEEATRRANEAATRRLRQITARLSNG